MRHYFQSQNIAFRVKEIQKEYKDVFLMDPLTHLPNEKKKRFEMGFKLLQGMTPMKDRYDDGIAKGTTI
jgi:hypothetical protein